MYIYRERGVDQNKDPMCDALKHNITMSSTTSQRPQQTHPTQHDPIHRNIQSQCSCSHMKLIPNNSNNKRSIKRICRLQTTSGQTKRASWNKHGGSSRAQPAPWWVHEFDHRPGKEWAIHACTHGSHLTIHGHETHIYKVWGAPILPPNCLKAPTRTTSSLPIPIPISVPYPLCARGCLWWCCVRVCVCCVGLVFAWWRCGAPHRAY
jgi:hypothetical protein